MNNIDPVETILDRLQGVKQAGPRQWQARCPAHDDRVASLSIGQGDDGRALIDCKAGCTTADVLAAVNMRMGDLFTTAPSSGPKTKPAHKASKAKTTYTTPEDAFAAIGRQVGGQLVSAWQYPGDVLRVARFTLADNRKTYRPIHRYGTGWAIGDPAGPLPLYRGDELPDTGPVVVVEGEKCADAAATVGLSAVTSAHGAGSAQKTEWRPLAGREVIILPDHDEAGQKYAQEVAAILAKLSPAATVRIVDLPGLGEHEDLADWIGADGPMSCKTVDEVRAAIMDMARAAAPWTPPASNTEAAPVITRLADVQPEPVKWLWPNRIALGKLTLLAGDPGLGKSFITLDMAARISTGRPWPDCPNVANLAGGVVLLTAEDDLADTVRPRLDAAGADVTRIIALSAVKYIDADTGKERQFPFNIANDLLALERAILQLPDARVVVIDPFSAYLGGTDSHKNAEVRALLAPLSELAARHGVAVIAVTHLRKGEGPAMYRAMGSLAFVAAARAAYAVTKDKDDPTGKRRFMLPVKNNLGDDLTGLAYCLDNTWSANGQAVVKWEAIPISITADEALRPDTGNREAEPSELDEAKNWLKDTLGTGPKPAKEIITQARQEGISKRTLDRAKKSLSITASKEGFDAGWTWRLPSSEGEHAEEDQALPQEPLATFGDVGNLREPPKETGNLLDAAKGDEAEDCQPAESGSLQQLDPDRPGPLDILNKGQRARYLAIYHSRPADMHPVEKHSRAWKAALKSA